MSRLLLSCIFLITLCLTLSLCEDTPSEVQKRIIDGKPVSKIEWTLTRPWLGKNVCNYRDGKGWVACGCSSTIINEHFLLTAGHCLNGPYTYDVGVQFSDGKIYTDFTEIHTPNWQYGSILSKETCGLRSVIIGDVGLQYFKKPIHLGWGVSAFPAFFRRVLPVFPGTKATIEGWGATTEQGADFYAPIFADQLQKLDETVFSNSDCQVKVQEWLAVLDYVSGGATSDCSFTFTNQLICAGSKPLADIAFSYNPPTFGYPYDPAGICTGDSGSPLVDSFGRILGTVSDTLSTSLVGPCGYGLDVYTRLSQEIVDWIATEVRKKGILVEEY